MASARLLPARPLLPGRISLSEHETCVSATTQLIQPFPRARTLCVRASTSFSSAEPLSLGPRPDLPSALEDASRAQSAGPHPARNPPLFREELDKLLRLLPDKVSQKLLQHPDIASLVEIVLDLGRVPIARFASGDWVINDEPVSAQDLELTVSQVHHPSPRHTTSGTPAQVHHLRYTASGTPPHVHHLELTVSLVHHLRLHPGSAPGTPPQPQVHLLELTVSQVCNTSGCSQALVRSNLHSY